MTNNYTFLSDHSYSLRPDADDNDELPLNQREEKNKKRRQSSNRTEKTILTENRAVSIDRSSSDKENNSLVLTNSKHASISAINSNESSLSNVRLNKKKSNLRSSTRTTMNNSRTSTGKKQDNKTTVKTNIKSSQGSINKKKKRIKRNNDKTFNLTQNNFSDVPPSLSIEERVKLRRTKPLQPSTTISPIEKKPVKINKSRPVKQEDKSINNKTTKSRKTSLTVSTVKTTKLFLGSGLDLDNIVLGNRQRRCVQT